MPLTARKESMAEKQGGRPGNLSQVKTKLEKNKEAYKESLSQELPKNPSETRLKKIEDAIY